MNVTTVIELRKEPAQKPMPRASATRWRRGLCMEWFAGCLRQGTWAATSAIERGIVCNYESIN